MMNEQIKILIVDDNALVRQGLAALIETAPGMVIVGEATNGTAAINKTLTLHPDVVIMDLIKPGLDGIEAIKGIKQKYPQVRILVLTNFGDEQRVISAFQAGAQGYLLKDGVLTDIVAAIRDIYEGKLTLHPTLTDFFIQAIQESVNN